jgi:hypothetical protein
VIRLLGVYIQILGVAGFVSAGIYLSISSNTWWPMLIPILLCPIPIILAIDIARDFK